MIFNLEKERSALATVTGRVANSTQAVANSGIDDVMSELIMTFSMSNTVFVASSSLLNSRLKDRTSDIKLVPVSDEYVCCSFVAANSKSISDKFSRDLG